MIDLIGKTALIIGGMNALAEGAAKGLSSAGAKIILAYIPSDHDRAIHLVERLANQGSAARAEAVPLDDPAALARQVAALGPLNIAVISPAWWEYGQFMDAAPPEWDAALTRNYEQAVYAAQAVARYLIGQGSGGRLIFLSSAATLMPLVEMSAVGTTLSMLRPLAKMAAVDLGQYGITVNIIAVGCGEAGWSAPAVTPDETHLKQEIPLGRLATPEDVGHACCFLASDLASYITGAVLTVDGGYSLTRAERQLPPPSPAQPLL